VAKSVADTLNYLFANIQLISLSPIDSPSNNTKSTFLGFADNPKNAAKSWSTPFMG
jgi:hypothetical protein